MKRILIFLPALLIILPILILLSGSIMDTYELTEYLLPVFAEGDNFLSWRFVPKYPTFENYGRLLFLTPQFFVLFFNSIKVVACILAGQMLIAVPAAWAFAVYPVRGGRAVFAGYIVLMLLPFQVTMLSTYLVLNKLSILNTHAAIILPAVFSTFPVFLSYGGFRGIPKQLFEAARIDGAGELVIFFPDRTAAWKKRNALGYGVGFFGILEYDRTADGFSGRQVAVAAFSLSSADYMGTGGICLCGLGDHADSGSFCFPAWSGLFRAGNCVFGVKGITGLF